MGNLAIVNLSEEFTGYHQRELPEIMVPEMMRKLLGGEFPDTGFSWECVTFFKYEDGVWEPYNSFDEILPAAGFVIKVKTIDC